ncbi:hypothetical protein [Desulfobulbus propionicus]|jgi:hypothetical protein
MNHFISSQPLSDQQWVFLHRQETRADWQRLEDVRRLRIDLTIGSACHDVLNFRELLDHRIDLFPVEKTVEQYLMTTNSTDLLIRKDTDRYRGAQPKRLLRKTLLEWVLQA